MSKATSQPQLYEYLLFGNVSESELTSLLHRLRGLCDFATCGGIPFADKEQTFKIEAGNIRSFVKVRQSLDAADTPWQLIYSGQLELGDGSRPAGIRTCVHTACSHNVCEFLKDLGFVAGNELILKGYLFRKGQMKVTVFKMYKPGDNGGLENAHSLSDHYLVELSAVTASGYDNVGSEMKAFAEHLKPIVTMEKTDGSR